MVRADRHPGDFHSVLSRARPAASARADDDARSRGRDARVVHEINAARGGACLQLRLPASGKEKVATNFWTNVRRGDTELLSAAPIQSPVRCASRGLVRAESSGRRFCRDIRGLAHARTRLAPTLRRLESATKTRINRYT